MSGTATSPPDVERRLEEHRVELIKYRYRMLGSSFEAEDAVQETMVRGRAYDRFEARSVAVLALPDCDQRLS